LVVGKKQKMSKTDLKIIILSEDWIITDLTFDEEFGKYHVTASHISGKVIDFSKTKKHVDKILKDIENEQE
tara:strand:+ start:195 stop:407 length:213 start_codon:yes stop_codon:yes gene_type:complete